MNQDIVKIIANYVTTGSQSVAHDFQNVLGVNFDTTKVCGRCLRQINGETVTEHQGNVRSIFEKCRGLDGCVVCAVCGFALFRTITDAVEHARGVSPCSKCGAVQFIAATKFRGQVANAVAAAAVRVHERERELRCIDLFGVVAGACAYARRACGEALGEEQMLDILRVTLDAVGLTECDLYVNRFFDRIEEAMDFADRLESGHLSHGSAPA